MMKNIKTSLIKLEELNELADKPAMPLRMMFDERQTTEVTPTSAANVAYASSQTKDMLKAQHGQVNTAFHKRNRRFARECCTAGFATLIEAWIRIHDQSHKRSKCFAQVTKESGPPSLVSSASSATAEDRDAPTRGANVLHDEKNASYETKPVHFRHHQDCRTGLHIYPQQQEK